MPHRRREGKRNADRVWRGFAVLAKIFRNERFNFQADRFPPSAFSDVFGNVYAQCIELIAGRAAERMLLDDEPAPPTDDLRQARELAMLICTSEEAIETFIAHCDVAARDLLMPHGDVVIVVSTVLRIKRTLSGAEIDALISDLQARKAAAIERQRRNDWRNRELAANCHLDLLAFNASAISMVELATNWSIGALSMTVAFRSKLVASFESTSPALGDGRLGSDERLPDE